MLFILHLLFFLQQIKPLARFFVWYSLLYPNYFWFLIELFSPQLVEVYWQSILSLLYFNIFSLWLYFLTAQLRHIWPKIRGRGPVYNDLVSSDLHVPGKPHHKHASVPVHKAPRFWHPFVYVLLSLIALQPKQSLIYSVTFASIFWSFLYRESSGYSFCLASFISIITLRSSILLCVLLAHSFESLSKSIHLPFDGHLDCFQCEMNTTKSVLKIWA